MIAGQGRHLNEVDLLVLRAVNRYRYLTAAQLNRLLWPENVRDENRYPQRRLQRLVKDEYVLPLRNLPRPNHGTAPRVHALGWRGRRVLLELGEEVPSYYRPSELAASAENSAFMPHTLAVIDVLIAAERLVDVGEDIQLAQLLLEHTLRRLAPKVTVPGVPGRSAPRHVTVVPDAIFSLTVAGERQDFVLELDRGTERQHVWREKVAALTYWISSPASKSLVPSNDVTIIVVTDDDGRREALRAWTAEELRARGLFQEAYASLFAASAVRAALRSCSAPTMRATAAIGRPTIVAQFAMVPASGIGEHLPSMRHRGGHTSLLFHTAAMPFQGQGQL